MAQPTTSTGLLRAASRATTLAETESLIGEAEQMRTAQLVAAREGREIDLANAIITDHLTPVRVHEHHTAATDWVGSVDTTGGTDVEREMVAQGSLWYSKLHLAVRTDQDEFEQQAVGMGRRLSGAYGERADTAQQTFLQHVGQLWSREDKAGLFTESSSGVPQIGEPGAPVAEATVGPPAATGLPGELTSSERAPAIQAMENNAGPGPSGPVDPILPQSNPDLANGDEGDRTDDRPRATTTAHHNHGRTASMQTAPCPSCAGRGRVAVRTQAASGLDQIEQIVDSHDNPSTTPLPPEVAFPWEMDAGAQQNAIAETEQQLAEREQRKGASRTRVAELAAHQAAQLAYRRVMAGQDDSGWAGNMGAGGVTPGYQDGGNPAPPSNLGQPDPVYGYGGDQGDKQLKPYGADEANDYTNNPGQNWQPGQPTQMDQAARPNMVGQPTASLDPEIAKAERFIAHRRALLAQQQR